MSKEQSINLEIDYNESHVVFVNEKQIDKMVSIANDKLSPQEKFRATAFLPRKYQITAFLHMRFRAYDTLKDCFAHIANIMFMDTAKLRESAANLVDIHLSELEYFLVSVLMHYKAFFQGMEAKNALVAISYLHIIHNYVARHFQM